MVKKRLKILFLTQNEASFRMEWLDSIARYADVKVFHLNEYAVGIDRRLVSCTPQKAISEDASISIFGRKYFKIHKIFRERYDVLILDGYGFLAQQVVILLLNLLNKHFIMSIDGGFVRLHENPIKRTLKTLLISSADAFFSTGEDTDKFISFYNKKKDICIYRHKFSSVHLDEISEIPNQREKENLRKKWHIENRFTIICVGRIIPEKGFDVLIQTLEYLPRDVQICFAGAGDVAFLEPYINPKNKDRIFFLGHFDRKQLNEIYRCADVFVLPTRGDVWGLVVGEAMAKGLPVITTDKCLAGTEMIKNGENGYIYPVEDVIALAHAIELIYNNPMLKIKMGQNNIELIRQYAIENAAQDDVKNLMSLFEKRDL